MNIFIKKNVLKLLHKNSPPKREVSYYEWMLSYRLFLEHIERDRDIFSSWREVCKDLRIGFDNERTIFEKSVTCSLIEPIFYDRSSTFNHLCQISSEDDTLDSESTTVDPWLVKVVIECRLIVSFSFNVVEADEDTLHKLILIVFLCITDR